MAKLLKRSPHFAQHAAHGAKKFFDFAGWEMPMHFSSLEEEVKACRTSAVLFDGHAMGEIHVKGKDALKAVQKLCANDISKAQPGQCVYSALCKEDGGIFDDLVVFCIAPDHYLLTIAAFNLDKSPPWIERHIQGMDACMEDRSAGTTCLEIQGPTSRQILQAIAEFDVSNDALPYYRFVTGKVADIDCMVARLGVTGELGYELFYEPGYAYQMYDAIVAAGKDKGLALCGNGTVRIFRLEKVYHIYTRDIDESTNPFEAGLGHWVKLNKGNFIGRDALLKVKERGVSRKLVGFSGPKGAGAIAPGSTLEASGRKVGTATNAGYSPTLDRPIGLGYVPVENAEVGTQLTVSTDANKMSVTVVEIPFVDPKGRRIRM
jgi:glycine cleavage system T protein (aminomethyltransferase)